MNKKVLFVASVERHLAGFHTPYLKMLKDQGYEIHTAASGKNEIECVDSHFDLDFTREPFTCKNWKAYRQLETVINENSYTFVHCHTPAASVLTRLASRKARKKGMKVVYTAHGFHFYGGGPKFSDFLYRSIEKYVSRYTDAILTINEEDFKAVRKYNFKTPLVFRTRGVGCDGGRFFPAAPGEKEELRQKFAFPAESFIMIYPAELCYRKNQQLLLKAVAALKERIPHILLLLPGTGADEADLKKLAAELGIEGITLFLGQRNDVNLLMKLSDLDVASSRQEGLGMHIVEALRTGIPSVASEIRGHTELIRDGKNGFYFKLGSSEELEEKIFKVYEISKDPALKGKMRICCIESAEPFLLENTLKEMAEIYDKIL